MMYRILITVVALNFASGCTEDGFGELLFPCSTNSDCSASTVCATDRLLCVPPSQLVTQPILRSAPVRGIAFLDGSLTRYWYDDQTIARASTPAEHIRSSDEGLAIHGYSAGPVVVLEEGLRFRAYYADGTSAVGDGYVFGEREPVTLPADKTMSSVVGVAWRAGRTFAFFDDDTFTIGSPNDLRGVATPFIVAEAKTATAIAAMAFDDDGVLHTVCDDGTVLIGAPENLSATLAIAGPVASAFATPDNDLVIVYHSGFVKVFDGSIVDNWAAPRQWAGDWTAAKPLRWTGYVSFVRNPREIVGVASVWDRTGTSTTGEPCVADLFDGNLIVYYRSGHRSFGDGLLRDGGEITGFDVSARILEVTIKRTEYGWEDILDVMVSQNQEALCDGSAMFVWFDRGKRFRGSADRLGDHEGEHSNFTTTSAGARNIGFADALFNEKDGVRGQWTLYRDGTFSRGWSQCSCGFCSSPVVACGMGTACKNQRLDSDGTPFDCRERPR